MAAILFRRYPGALSLIVLLSLAAVVVATFRHAPAVRAQHASPAERPSVQDALRRPTVFSFADPTPLTEVAHSLQKTHGVRVVLDRAALTRLDLNPEDTVQLQLDGVRLQTSLQLLLDQVGMTFRVVPEDNLLILTDNDGADDPYRRILSEIDILHREVHDLRDTVDALYDELFPPEGDPPVHNPTLIEPLPGATPQPQPPGAEPRRRDTSNAARPRRARPAADPRAAR